MSRKTSDIISGLVLLCLCAALYFYLIPNFVDGTASGAMSPRFFPRLGAILIGGGGAALVLASVLRAAPVASEPGATGAPRHPAIFPVALLSAAAMAGFILLFQWVGYFYAAPALIAVLMVLFGARKPLMIFLTAGIATGVLFAVFNLGLNLPLV